MLISALEKKVSWAGRGKVWGRGWWEFKGRTGQCRPLQRYLSKALKKGRKWHVGSYESISDKGPKARSISLGCLRTGECPLWWFAVYLGYEVRKTTGPRSCGPRKPLRELGLFSGRCGVISRGVLRRRIGHQRTGQQSRGWRWQEWQQALRARLAKGAQ